MAALVGFVDQISASPTVRLDLNDGTIWRVVMQGSDFSPPNLRRATSTNMLSDGDYISASAYSNRTVTLQLQLITGNADEIGEEIQKLGQELDRPTNTLRVWRDGATEPVFFKTIRVPISSVREQLTNHREVRVSIDAEPFALGLKETLSAANISNDPATGCYLDIDHPKGDVETPLYLRFDAGDVIAAGRRQSSMAMRRRGTPGNAPWIIQAESMTRAANTALNAFSATMSGAGQNSVRASSLTSTYVRRLTSPLFPSSPSVDARGKYRPVVRVAKTTGSGEVRVRLVISPDGTNWITPDGVGVVLPTGTQLRWAELPVIQIPIGHDPVTDGPSGLDLASAGIYFGLEICITAGSSNLDIDAIVMMPADDRYCRVLWPGSGSPTSMVLDSSARPKVYGLGASGETYSTEIPGLDSGTPLISPNAYNRMWFLLDTGTTSTAGDVISNSTDVTGYYWPRYLSTNRPAFT